MRDRIEKGGGGYSEGEHGGLIRNARHQKAWDAPRLVYPVNGGGGRTKKGGKRISSSSYQ
jgi:hypothetical protein